MAIEGRMTNYKKLILTTVLWTLTALVGISAIFSCIMVFAFPKNVGDFFYSLGSDGLASSMYMRVYEKEGDVSYCYKALNIEINRNKSDKIVTLYETFEKDENSNDFLAQLKIRNEKLDVGVLEKSSLLNEEDYLKNRYVKALIATGNARKAYNLALDYFKSYQTFDLKNQGVYAINHFVSLEGYNDFSVTPAGFTGSLLEALKDYFYLSNGIFEDNINSKTSLDHAYLISLGNRIVQVGQNINTICNDESLIQENKTQIEKINNYVKDILNLYENSR